MKESNTADRLKLILKEKNMRAIDLVNKCQPLCKKYNIKLGRNDVSQYLSGKFEPSQKKLSLLAEVLNVNEVWLMGYKVNKIELSEEDFLNNEQIINGYYLNKMKVLTADKTIRNVFNENDEPDELELLFDKHKEILTESDKTLIKTIIEQRKLEIDKELGEE